MNGEMTNLTFASSGLLSPKQKKIQSKTLLGALAALGLSLVHNDQTGIYEAS